MKTASNLSELIVGKNVIKLKHLFHWNKNKCPPPIIGSIDVLEYILAGKNDINIGKDGEFNIDYNSYSLVFKDEEKNKKNVMFKNESFIDKFKLLYAESFGNEMSNFIPINSKEKKNIIVHEPFINKLLDDHSDISKTLDDINFNNDLIHTYRLSEVEKNYCIMISKNIAFHNTISGAKERKFTSRDPVLISIQGNFGELAVARILKLPCQMHFTYPRSTITDTFDGTLANKYKIDIKTVVGIGRYPLLVMEHKKSNPADLYILAEVGFVNKEGKHINCNNMNASQKDKMINDPEIIIEVNIAGFSHKNVVFNSPKSSLRGSYSLFYKVERSALLNLQEIITYLKQLEHSKMDLD